MVDVLHKPIDVECFYNILIKYIKVQHSFNDRLSSILLEFNSLIEQSSYNEILKICRVLNEEVKINIEASNIKLLGISNSISPIFGIVKTQEKQISKSIEAFAFLAEV